jgi:hypothetical protein
MGYNAFIVDCCGRAVWEGWEFHSYCEGCGACVCEDCLDESDCERDEHSELWECPVCTRDQFQHMNPNYCP